MYFPYLHGRQAELQAIRSAASDFGKPQQILPVIEPVDPPGKLEGALEHLKSTGNEAYLVVNPHQGGVRVPTVLTAWQAALAPWIGDPTVVRPMLKETSEVGLSEVNSFITANKGRKIALLLTSSRFAPADVASSLAGSDSILFLAPTVSAVGYATAVGAHGVVEIQDNFPSQARNSDYSGEEWLANNHLNYLTAGQPGFSDFTVLPGAFRAGGGPVGAAAFHLSYRDASGEFWVHHFVSDETDRNVGNSSSKLLEALTHLNSVISSNPTKFAASPALASYMAQYKADSPTNLSNNKKQQISHHLFEVARHLGI